MTGEDRTTPRPWVVGFEDGSGTPTDESGGWVVNGDGDVIVRGGNDGWGVPLGVEGPNDAALIVEAVNDYDRLRAIEEAAIVVVSKAELAVAPEPDDDPEGQFVEYLVPAEALAALRDALRRSTHDPK